MKNFMDTMENFKNKEKGFNIFLIIKIEKQ